MMKFPSLIYRSFLIITPLSCGAQSLYDFGNPTADEQLYIELINRARENPTAEGQRLARLAGEGNTAETNLAIKKAVAQFSVNLTMMKNEFAAIAPAPPLAPNAALMNFAREHSQYMLTNGVQSHDQVLNGKTFVQRVTALAPAYNQSGFSENVYSTSRSVVHSHAGFQIDWGKVNGVDVGGMQPDRGHRDNIHDVFDSGETTTTARREIGVGVKYGSHANGKAGPSAVTQDFSRQAGYTFVSGVAYYDLDGNNFYDVGEGISGLTVNVTNHDSGFNCNTAIGGGWVVPVNNAAATRRVTFSGLNFSGLNPDEFTDVVFPGNVQKKQDLKLTYTPPAIASTATANVGTAKSVTFPAIRGATGYKWHRWTTSTATTEEANNTNNVNTNNSQMLGNPMTNTSIKDTGAASFWLANYDENFGSRWIELSRLYRAGNSPTLTFRSRLLKASVDDIHKVQVKEEGSVVWTDVYTQAGTGPGGAVESAFSTRTANIAAFANKTFRVRFMLDHEALGVSLTGTPDNTDGWFIDNIAFTNIQHLENDVPTNLNTNGGTYTPSAVGTILQSIAPVISGREFPGAYQTLTIAAALPVTPTFANWATTLETTNLLPAGTLAAANGDHDKDGRVNLLEYAFGTSPVSASEAAPRWPKIQSATATSIVIEYQVDLALTDLTVTPEATLTLGTWYGPNHPDKPSGFAVSNLTTINNIETRRATLPLSAGQKGFLRVKATQNP